MDLIERFLKYVKVNTTSDPHSESVPSSPNQWDLAKILVEDMKEIGIDDAHVDEFGVVYGSIASNLEKECDTVGFIAHMDTSPDMSGKDVKPRIIYNYDGETILLNEELNISMDTNMFPTLKDYIGHDIIVTDGTTLLGADDKAGVAEILDMCDFIIKNNIPHGNIKIAFTPDEEVGAGADHFNIEKFNADYAFTVDGGDIDDINYENFNAADAVIKIKGSSIHPGDAKNKMINASLLAMKFDSLLPEHEIPACTENREGFHHLIGMETNCEEATMEYIIRNHDEKIFERQKEDFYRAKKYIDDMYGENTVTIKMEDSYYNMRTIIEKNMKVVEVAEKALKELGYTPKHTPIRGGTDGARLTFDGLICPNLGTGGRNYHGKYEYVSIQVMNDISKLLVKIIELIANE